MKVSWLILTHNRNEVVGKSFEYNKANAGMVADEVILVDNGSTTPISLSSDVRVRNEKNRGVAIGYNQALSLARGDLLVITGCDTYMPKDWMKKMYECFEKISNTGSVAIYSKPVYQVSNRTIGEVQVINGIKIQPALPIDRRMFTRELLKGAGFLREDFGLYGYEDVEWAYRALKWCIANDKLSYVLPDLVAEHLGTEGILAHDGKDGKEYHEFKKKQVEDPAKEAKMKWCRDNNFPYYNPYAN